MWDEITYPFPNLNSATIAFWEWIINYGCKRIQFEISKPVSFGSMLFVGQMTWKILIILFYSISMAWKINIFYSNFYFNFYCNVYSIIWHIVYCSHILFFFSIIFLYSIILHFVLFYLKVCSTDKVYSYDNKPLSSGHCTISSCACIDQS